MPTIPSAKNTQARHAPATKAVINKVKPSGTIAKRPIVSNFSITTNFPVAQIGCFLIQVAIPKKWYL